MHLTATTPQFGNFTMALRRLFDVVQPHLSSFKVLERKEKVTIALAKVPPPRLGEDAYVNYKQWCVSRPARPRVRTVAPLPSPLPGRAAVPCKEGRGCSLTARVCRGGAEGLTRLRSPNGRLSRQHTAVLTN